MKIWFLALSPQEHINMESGNSATIAYPLGYDKGTEILLKAVQRLRQKDAGNDLGTAVVEVEDVPPSKDTQIIEDKYLSGNSLGSLLPLNKVPTYVEAPPGATKPLSAFSAIERGTNIQTYGDVSTSEIPTYPTIPKLRSSNVTDIIHQTDTFTVPSREPLSSLSRHKLTTEIEHKPPTYQPTCLPLERIIPAISITETDEVNASDDTTTGISNAPPHRPSSRTSTMCSAVSAKSHQEAGPIYISPSAQLQSMQSISELDARLSEVHNLRKPWVTSRYNRTSGQATYTPTGTPESISNVPLSAGILEAHSRLNENILSQYVDAVDKHDWARSSEWVQPCAVDNGPREWIEDFLRRQEQADRDEDSERQRHEKQDKRHGGIRGRVNSADKFRRKLSKRRLTGERRSFEARQERRNGGVLDMEIGSSPYRKASIPISGEDLERSARSRAFSWSPDTYEPVIYLSASPNRSSWTPRSSTSTLPSPIHRIHAASRLHTSLPSRHPCKRKLSNCSSFNANHHRTASALQRVATRQYSHSPLRTSSWEKLKVKNVASMSSDVKRNFSTGLLPVISNGKESVKSLVSKMESVSESVTRKLSASWKGRWKGLGRKKQSMNVGGLHVIGRER